MKTEVLNLRLDEEEREMLEELAKRWGTTMAGVFRFCLRSKYAEESRDPAPWKKPEAQQ